jgi:ketosteroid isomerase-like protein
MSQTDIEALKEGFDAYNGGDFERLLELWDEDVEIVGLLVSGEPLRGREAARNWLIPEAIDQRAEPVVFRDLEGRVLVTCDWHIHGSCDWHIHGREAAWTLTPGSASSSPCERARLPAWRPMATSRKPSKPPGCGSRGSRISSAPPAPPCVRSRSARSPKPHGTARCQASHGSACPWPRHGLADLGTRSRAPMV